MEPVFRSLGFYSGCKCFICSCFFIIRKLYPYTKKRSARMRTLFSIYEMCPKKSEDCLKDVRAVQEKI